MTYGTNTKTGAGRFCLMNTFDDAAEVTLPLKPESALNINIRKAATIGESLTSRTHWFKLHVATVTRCPMVEFGRWRISFCVNGLVQVWGESSHSVSSSLSAFIRDCSSETLSFQRPPTTPQWDATEAGSVDKLNGTDSLAVVVSTDPSFFVSPKLKLEVFRSEVLELSLAVSTPQQNIEAHRGARRRHIT